MDHTIAAVATPYGEGGIGIIRVSGEESERILLEIFRSASDKSLVPRMLTYGHIHHPETGEILDEVLAVFMKGPGTYTGEDVAEIHCHGSIVALRRVLYLVLERGARLAEPGEFTKRAFLNGRLDLVQAEAVIDLVKARSEKGFDVAIHQLEGSLSKEVSRIRDQLMDLLVQLAVNIDYPDEDIEEMTYESLKESLSQIGDEIENIISTADTGRMIREGIGVAIVGKPNVGKSSFMNALLRESRAIVTDIPGTTRDTIEEYLNIRGIPIKLTDTAGIRQTDDRIESIGIEKSKEAFNRSDLVLFILDGSQEISPEDREIMDLLQGRKALVLINKEDLNQKITYHEVAALLPDARILHTSTATGSGIQEVEAVLEDLVYGGEVKQTESLLVSNVRQKDLLVRALSFIRDGRLQAEAGAALDFIEIDVKSAWELLGEIIGETVTDTIIEEVFARFCLGK